MQHIKLKIIWKKAFAIYALLFFCYSSGYGQESIQVSGKVTYKNGESLPGISVILLVTKVGTNTDDQGQYRLSVPNWNGILSFTNVGYVKKEAKIVQGKSTYDVILEEDLLGLDEVVVVGYGTQRKSDITGSVAVVDVA